MSQPVKYYREPTIGGCQFVLFTVMFLSGLPTRWGIPVIPSKSDEPPAWLCGFAVAIALSAAYWTGYRIVGLMLPAVTVLTACAVSTYQLDFRPGWMIPLHGLAVGTCFAAYFRYIHRCSRVRLTGFNFPTLPHWTDFVLNLSVPLAVFIVVLADPFKQPADKERVAIAFLIAWFLLTIFAWVRLFREFFELCVEPVLWLSYRIRGTGPGLAAIPYHGPLIVLANHSCWWDPLFLAKIMPRPITPMMTSKFFDIWFIRPLMVYVFRTIRVQDGTVRRHTPEIEQAIAALDAGKCVVLFPEGYLRRKEDVPLRRFGRGIWEILRARPDTPVIACWIEGNWGSWVSWAGGPPMKNKSPDFRRRIDVGVSEPIVLSAELLTDHLPTRYALMNAVSEAGKHVGLLPLPPFECPTSATDTDQSE